MFTKDIMATERCADCISYSNSFFSKLAKDTLPDLDRKKDCITFRKNMAIFTAGTRPNGIYCLKSGMIKIFKTGEEGRQHIIRLVVPGEFFGLRTAVADDYYTSSAVALEDSKVCIIGREDFQQLICKHPQFTNFIIAFLCDRIDEANSRLISMAQKPVRERLAETLVILDRIYGASIPDPPPKEAEINLSREDMANIIGTAPETLIRLLSDFKNDGLISVKGRRISVLEIHALKKIAGL